MLLLASASPARHALLTAAGLRFEARPVQIDERRLEAAALEKGAGPDEVADSLARAKALATVSGDPELTMIGADQVLALDGDLLHKPVDRNAAARQLDRLRGTTHQLFSAVALARAGRVLWSHVETAELRMRSFSIAERDRILDLEGDAALGSVGAYRLEGPSIQLFEHIGGDYFTILGLPLLPLLAALRLHAPDELEGFT